MYMTFEEKRIAIEGKFLTDFDSSVIPVQFGNNSGLIKGTKTIQQDKAKEFVRLSILDLDNTPTRIGNSGCATDRVIGQVVINIFVRENTGEKRINEIVDLIFPIFNKYSDQNILFRNTVVTGLPQESGWHQKVLSIEYQWDKC